jgi:hypothetical protein
VRVDFDVVQTSLHRFRNKLIAVFALGLMTAAISATVLYFYLLDPAGVPATVAVLSSVGIVLSVCVLGYAVYQRFTESGPRWEVISFGVELLLRDKALDTKHLELLNEVYVQTALSDGPLSQT